MATERGRSAEKFGVYVHIPFCRHRCDYCAFATYTDRDHLMARYADACIAEIAAAVDVGTLRTASSVFFGGGTPSRLDPKALSRILSAIPRPASAEVTVECNPEDADFGRLSAYREAGVTRMSFGVQSMVPHVLEALGRHHDPASVARMVRNVGLADFVSWNLDLIFGVPAETEADWLCTLHAVLDLDVAPPHISAYALTVEPGTPLAADPRRHPDDDVQARRYELADHLLCSAGYRWEEISNWALPGHGCAHNQLYWQQGDYLGIGSAAHSHRSGRRWWNVRTPERYVAAIEAGRSPVAGEEVLTADQRAFEALALSLRTPRGVPDDALANADELDGLVERRDGRVTLTARGRLVSNALTARLDAPSAVS